MTDLLLDERILADGSLARTYARVDGDRLRVRDDEGADGELSVAALDRVMTRYGLPLDETISLPASRDALELAGGRRLSRLRYHAPVDATGRDYLVWERPGEPPLAVIATHATAALRYLVLRLDAEYPRKTEG
ncbi:MAG: hypothetical protein JO257_38120 [Deltaproteobacteria bacterium]|nr:hypothetical protein [Deltaproteobacteria bacterium]